MKQKVCPNGHSNPVTANVCSTCGLALGSATPMTQRADGWGTRVSKKSLLVIVILLSFLALLVFIINRYTPKQEGTQETETILRIHGSDTMGEALIPALAEGFLRAKGFTGTEKTQKDTGETIVKGVSPMDGKVQAIEIMAEGTGTGISDLAEGKGDIAQASREIKPEEEVKLGGRERIDGDAIAMDGVCFIVNERNPIMSLSLKQLQAIFTRDKKNWEEVDPEIRFKGPINLYVRRYGRSGTYDFIKEKLLGGGDVAIDSDREPNNSESLVAAVASDPYGIGFVAFPYVKGVTGITPLKIENYPPNEDSILQERYEFSRPLYLYFKKAGPKYPLIKEFLAYAASEKGQLIVEQQRFIRWKIKLNALDCEDIVDDEGLKNFQKGNLVFRFGSTLSALDMTRSEQLLDRWSREINEKYRRSKIIVLGFADPTPGKITNEELSMQRAEDVASRLRQKVDNYIIPKGLGSKCLIAKRTTDRVENEKNRRVEVLIEALPENRR